jgi:hypothetical protein
LTVTACVTLVEPISVGAKLNAPGAASKDPGVRPVPLRVVVAAATPVEVLVAVKNACRPPATVGAKLTTSVQLPPATSVCPQPDETIAKSLAAAPVTPNDSPESPAPPGLAIVNNCPALLFPIVVATNCSVSGLRLSEAGVCPAPASATFAAETPRLLVDTVTAPLCAPPTRGAKVTGTLQLPPAAKLVPQLPDPTLNGASVAIESPVSAPVPGFDTINGVAELLLPTSTVPNWICSGVTTSCAAGTPVPVNPSTTGVNPTAVEWIVTDPIRVPGAAGEKVAVKAQLVPLANCVPHWFCSRL